MITPPQTRAEAEKLTYGRFGEVPFNPARCCFSVWVTGMGFGHSKQCSRKPGLGPDGLYCRQHDPEEKAARDRHRDNKWNQKMLAERPKWYANEMLKLLKESQSMSIDGGSWCSRRDVLIKLVESEE